jgi:stage IV sporulation protein FB
MTFRGAIPITVRPLFWVISFFIGWMWTNSFVGALICVGVIGFSVLFHEFGHALTALYFNQKVRIELAAFGGFTYREGERLKLWKEFLVVLAGPVAGALLACITYLIAQTFPVSQPLVAFALKFTYVANFFWTMINLIPIMPLDGGHLLSILLEGLFGFKGVKWAIIIGLVLSIAVSILFFALGLFLVGALFLLLTFESFRSLRYYKLFSENDRKPELQLLVQEAEKDLDEEKVPQAIEKLEKVRAEAHQGILYTMASTRLAEIYHQLGEDEMAYPYLLGIERQLSGDQLVLFQTLAFSHKEFKKVTEISSTCYQESPGYKTALMNALSFAKLGDLTPALGWLECAIREGLPHPDQVLLRSEFDGIREESRFQSLRETLNLKQE